MQRRWAGAVAGLFLVSAIERGARRLPVLPRRSN